MNIEWTKLGFEFFPTRSNIRFSYKNGQWNEGRLTEDYNITMSIAAQVLHYGQACFEGQKAFCTKDGQVRIFRPLENARRMNDSLKHLLMPEFPEEKLVEAMRTVVKDNIDYVPPYGTGGSMYIRPVAFGTAPTIGVAASSEYELVIMVMPVGPYYKGGIKPVDAMMISDFDRAAPLGTGRIKCSGNYGASLLPAKNAKDQHCQVPLFTDPKEHVFVDEFGTSNFIGITKDGVYVTPESSSILPSITNKSLMELASEMGIKVERRRIHKSELANFAEVGACGTAVVITPIGRIIDHDKVYSYDTENIGPVLKKLYERMTGIQYGEISDTHDWMVTVK
ncbi:MAG: branched-chain amino acid aminotransferase [Victivallaceae bacterium]|jgi:branched-chain amino acid aminotransferase|nr:branched-chain amino acid aminotransferase [Victivallaceae bacterium]NLK82763.1 branched-chain amino acid aminotransferase [Lentisphaerota bacterium]MDD3117523.1 branched-chain amino acid aminotransferase [Victivallaceae bacterium]MDD3703014.1 branched-chain amino acid aminotransferase [Victivallaceae bacterium]MDD4316882.1 branched-chain amino acid aminotransferase [Victivallaceae bacterium]